MKKIFLSIIILLFILTTTSCSNAIKTISSSTSNIVESSSTNSSTTSSSSLETTQDITKTGIYSGDYYNLIDTTDSTLLKKELNTLISKATKITYDDASSALAKTDSYDNTFVECIYTGQRLDPTNVGSTTGAWNREHVWAKTYGFGDKSYAAYSDINHLRVSEATINTSRSDSYFDNVSGSFSDDEFGNKWTSYAFEPRDVVKGDIARMLFYMTVRYDDANLDLELTDDIQLIDSSAKTLGGNAYLGRLSTLLKWAADDPVDSREISRNNGVYSIQGNRNPFIDHPEYAYYIFKDKCDSLNLTYDNFYDNNQYTSYNENALNKVDELISSIGKVTLQSEPAIENALNAYNELGQETKSFVKNYEQVQQAQYDYALLKQMSNQDTTIPTNFSFAVLTSKNGSLASNGVSLDYNAYRYYENKGIYASTSSPIKLSAASLYSTISSISFTLSANKGDRDSVITVSDGINTATKTYTVSKSQASYTLDISNLDLSKPITISITNEGANSVILRELSFNIN